ncbi:ABC transporter permease [Acidithiobacillus thiooxidans]|uniref:ABC transporter permease n=1 Tax=Acidithiobacillus thiooxidans TaxID=930 RepID=UPI001C066D52|nr:ABC transporter permease [Acidithiobacillus thiooxidans]MBU2749949.1 ABC transporter permease [Acidithiobacillus thiooxidans]
MTRNLRKIYPSLIFGVLFACAWQVGITIMGIKSYVIPTPIQIINAMNNNYTILMPAFMMTFKESFLGLVFAFIASMVIAPLVGRVAVIHKMIMPYLIVVQTTPIVAIAPLFVLWFGEGIESRICSSFAVTLVPMTITIAQSFSVEDGGRIDLFKVFGIGKIRTFFSVTLPLALPGIMSALKFGVALSVVGAIVGELVTADAGLGYVIIQASYEMNTPLLFAAILFSAVIGLIFYILVNSVAALVHLDRYYLSER